MIKRYCLTTETHEGPNSYIISRPSILGNPYSHLPEDKCLAIYRCKTRDEAIDAYSRYFDVMYGSNIKFTNAIDEIYDKYNQKYQPVLCKTKSNASDNTDCQCTQENRLLISFGIRNRSDNRSCKRYHQSNNGCRISPVRHI